MIGRTIGIVMGTTGMAAIAMAGVLRWDAAMRTSESLDLNKMKKSILTPANVEEAHHQVYQKVGEEKWEADVKPGFIRDVSIQTMWETGNVTPSWDDMSRWVKEHPDRAKTLLERHSPPPGKSPPASDQPFFR